MAGKAAPAWTVHLKPPMRSLGWIALALAFGLSETAHGQTVDEARKQMMLHTGKFLPPQPVPVPAQETVHAPNLLLDPAGLERDFEEARRLRNTGIALTVVGATIEAVAMYLVITGMMIETFGPVGESICDLLNGLNGGSGSCPSADQEAQTYFRYALITGIFGAGALGAGIPSWVAGSRRMRKARGYSVSIVPTAGSGFAGVGATLTF